MSYVPLTPKPQFYFQNALTKVLHRLHSSWAENVISRVTQGQNRKLQQPQQKITEFQLSTVLKNCGSNGALQEGKQAHCQILKLGFQKDMVLMTTLVDMYSKCFSIEESRRVFDEMPVRDTVARNAMITALCRSHFTLEAIHLFLNMFDRDVASWNALISGLALNSDGAKALFFFEKMQVEGVRGNVMTMVSVLSVCADMAALVNGKQVHGLVIKDGFELYLPIGNATLDMYGKSGRMEDACLCFNEMPFKNIVSWTSLIMGFGKHGLGLEALKTFDQMKLEGIVPNGITFLGVIFACSHAGLVDEGWTNFNSMISIYCMTPTMEHYTYGRSSYAGSGRLMEAFEFIETMPIEPDAKLLTAFLTPCFSYKNVELTRRVGERLLELEPKEAGAYILLSNFYGLVGDLENVSKVRRLMVDRGVRKEKASTWIEINKTIHTFESGDRSHPLHKDIYTYLKGLIKKMKNIWEMAFILCKKAGSPSIFKPAVCPQPQTHALVRT
ncbi:hypothetical protein IFM89_024255 [Coptis chinensis]|uniref:Pentatricopeptide repeat-containing protein n=1 Tax=Coptis chinensis TaxID=261450 RepID=A0A835LJ62_9MAGN|nr:hypothetical protein IFM89_024255 [Coptis chinensis]